MARHVFYVGDVMAGLRQLKAESVHCVVTSPPYWRLRDYRTAGQLGSESTLGEYLTNMVAVFREVRRVLRPDGVLWLNVGDIYAARSGSGVKAKDLVGLPWSLAFALREDGWHLRADVVWHKPNCFPESVSDRPTKAHEYVFLLTKGSRYVYDAEAIKEPAHEGGMRNRRTVWSIRSQRSYGHQHFAVFPEALAEVCIRAGTSEAGACPRCGTPWRRIVEDAPEYAALKAALRGKWHPNPEMEPVQGAQAGWGPRKGRVVAQTITVGWEPGCTCGCEEPVRCVVLDPFGGSGTVAVVAERLGRDSVYIDINPEYCDLAIRRLREQAVGRCEVRRVVLGEEEMKEVGGG